MRSCDLCGGVDALPRHIFDCLPGTPGSVPSTEVLRAAVLAGASDEAVAALIDPTTMIRHISCCAAAGCSTCGGN